MKQNYKLGPKQRLLGAGAYGKVFLSESQHNSEFKVAIKVLDKQKMKYNMENIRDEIAVLGKLDHPNIVKYFETYNDVKNIYLVMEYIDGK